MSAPGRYRITLKAQPGAVPAEVRLRRFLKLALRGFGLRCLAVEELPGEAPDAPPTPGNGRAKPRGRPG